MLQLTMGWPTMRQLAKAERNNAIFARWQSGVKQREIAKEHGISPARVCQIIRHVRKKQDAIAANQT
jgi:Mor family transcriptional regulator